MPCLLFTQPMEGLSLDGKERKAVCGPSTVHYLPESIPATPQSFQYLQLCCLRGLRGFGVGAVCSRVFLSPAHVGVCRICLFCRGVVPDLSFRLHEAVYSS